MIFPFLPFT